MAFKLLIPLFFMAAYPAAPPASSEQVPECSPPQRPHEGVSPFEDDGEPEEQAPGSQEGDEADPSEIGSAREPPPRARARAP
jgi:hypothetical protein